MCFCISLEDIKGVIIELYGKIFLILLEIMKVFCKSVIVFLYFVRND